MEKEGGEVKHSEQLDQLATALVAIQAAVPAIPKDAANPFFKSKYADLPAVMATAAPIVTAHGVAVVQTMGHEDGYDTLTNLVVHTSGQWIADTQRLHLVKDDPQGHGSAVTYARRYAYMAALGLVADEDDDGNAASKARKAQPPRPAPKKPDTVEAAEAKRQLLAAYGGDKEKAALAWGTRGSNPIPVAQLSELVGLAKVQGAFGDDGRPFVDAK